LPALQRVPPRPPSLYRSKCKLYRYDNDAAEWKERGVGQGRILKHKENKKVRR
jgi:Ran-binding protein 1